jgi:AcrR family transcriptional regulator
MKPIAPSPLFSLEAEQSSTTPPAAPVGSSGETEEGLKEPNETGAATGRSPSDEAAYHRARHRARAGLRAELIELADQRLQQEGPGALSMRRLANAAGCSTMVLYSTFGDKAGLLAALAQRETERWIDAVTMFADPDPVAWFDAAATALWSVAGSRPHHRNLLFGPDQRSEAAAELRRALIDAIDQSAPGALEDGVAEAVWSAWAGALALTDGARFEGVQRGLSQLWRAYVAARGLG